MSNETNTCHDCENQFDPDTEGQWSDVVNDYICESCYEQDVNSASTLFIVSPEGAKKFIIGDYVRFNEYGDPLWGEDAELIASREWRSTDGWRGYQHTTLNGWTEVLDGWTTGDWDDAVGRRKRDFNQWVEELIGGTSDCPFTVAVLVEPTSNVFSTGVSVLVKDRDRDDFITYLSDDYEALHESLS
jgi:hypothetical protein